MSRATQVSVVGAGAADLELVALARDVGRLLAEAECTLVCGGLGGVMEAACRGAAEAGGQALAIVPGADAAAANAWATVVVPTGLGHARNVLVVQAGDAVIALPGSHGTLSEVALALKTDRPVVGLRAWQQIEGVLPSDTPEQAVDLALRIARR